MSTKSPEQIYNDLGYKKEILLLSEDKEVVQEWLKDVYHITHQGDLPSPISVEIDGYTIDVLIKSIDQRYKTVQSKFGDLKDAVQDLSYSYGKFSSIVLDEVSDDTKTDHKDTIKTIIKDNENMHDNIKKEIELKASEFKESMKDFAAFYEHFSFILGSAISDKIKTDYKETMDIIIKDNEKIQNKMKKEMEKKRAKEKSEKESEKTDVK